MYDFVITEQISSFKFDINMFAEPFPSYFEGYFTFKLVDV